MSWVIVDRKNGKAVMETFSEKYAQNVLDKWGDRYEVIPASKWLARVNSALRQESRP